MKAEQWWEWDKKQWDVIGGRWPLRAKAAALRFSRRRCGLKLPPLLFHRNNCLSHILTMFRQGKTIKNFTWFSHTSSSSSSISGAGLLSWLLDQLVPITGTHYPVDQLSAFHIFSLLSLSIAVGVDTHVPEILALKVRRFSKITSFAIHRVPRHPCLATIQKSISNQSQNLRYPAIAFISCVMPREVTQSCQVGERAMLCRNL